MSHDVHYAFIALYDKNISWMGCNIVFIFQFGIYSIIYCTILGRLTNVFGHLSHFDREVSAIYVGHEVCLHVTHMYVLSNGQTITSKLYFESFDF